MVCTGTACYIKGAPALLAAMEKGRGIKPGETTPDGELSLLTARCLGSCGLAPAVVLDSAVMGKIGPDEMLARIDKTVAGRQAASAGPNSGLAVGSGSNGASGGTGK